jgi:hypothetical protein
MTGTFAVGGFTAPSMSTARVMARRRCRRPDIRERPRDPVGETGLGLVALDGERDGDAPRIGACVLGVDPGRGDRHPRDRAAHLRQVDLRDLRIARDQSGLQVERHLHLVGRGHVGRSRVEQLRQRRHLGGIRQHVELVRLGERGVLARLDHGGLTSSTVGSAAKA